MFESLVEIMVPHLTNRNKPGMTKIKVRKIEKLRAKINGIVIIQRITVKTLLRMGRDCQMMTVCRSLPEISRETSVKTSRNQEYTLFHKITSTNCQKINKNSQIKIGSRGSLGSLGSLGLSKRYTRIGQRTSRDLFHHRKYISPLRTAKERVNSSTRVRSRC